MEKCPTCKLGTIISSDNGDYCNKCGLVFESQKLIKVKTPRIPRQGKCTICKQKTDLQMHHIIPKRTKLPTGLVALCHNCHRIADTIANVLYPKDVKLELSQMELTIIPQGKQKERL